MFNGWRAKLHPEQQRQRTGHRWRKWRLLRLQHDRRSYSKTCKNWVEQCVWFLFDSGWLPLMLLTQHSSLHMPISAKQQTIVNLQVASQALMDRKADAKFSYWKEKVGITLITWSPAKISQAWFLEGITGDFLSSLDPPMSNCSKE